MRWVHALGSTQQPSCSISRSCLAVSDTVERLLCPLASPCRIYLAASLGSTSITRLHRYYGGSDSCRGLIACNEIDRSDRSPLFTHSSTAPILSPTTPIRLHIPFDEPLSISSYPYRVCSVHWPIARDQASPYLRRLAPYESRIEFNHFVNLRTGCSPSVASHPASRRRSYGRLQGRRAMPRWGLEPHCCSALKGAPRFLRSLRSVGMTRRVF